MRLHDFYLEELKRHPVPPHEVDLARFSPIVRRMIEQDMAASLKTAFDAEVERRIRGEAPYPKEVPVGILGSVK
jgi:hypothetical protein